MDPLDQGCEDPWYGDHSDFAAVFDQIQASVPGIVEYVRSAVAAASADAAPLQLKDSQQVRSIS
jgi:protein-tyrosine phosphatase